MNSTLSLAAAEWFGAGFDVFAVRPDGSKAPIGRWGGEPPPLAETQAAIAAGRTDGIGVRLGPSVVCIELEGRAIDRLSEVADHPLMRRLSAGCCEQSPSGGRHWFFRVDGDPGPKSVPAKSATGETMAEYRTGRHFMVVAPSAGRTHPSGRPYKFLAGDPSSIPTLTEQEAGEVRLLLGRLDERPVVTEATASSFAAGEDTRRYFNASSDVTQLLKQHGWRKDGRPYRRRDLGDDAPISQDFTRPGRARGRSATLTGKTLRCWSTSTPLPAEVPLTAFDIATAYGDVVFVHHETLTATTTTTLEAQRAEAGERLSIEAAYASVSAGADILLDRSKTGVGKSYRAISLCEGRRSLTVLPTHENCRERQQEFAARGLRAVVFPELDEQSCHPDWLEEAQEAQSLGLSVAATVCQRCTYRRGCRYRRESNEAQRADHRIATHARLLASPAVATDCDVVVVDEQVDEVFAPVAECRLMAIELVARAGVPGAAEACEAIKAGDDARPLEVNARQVLRLFRRGKFCREAFGEGLRFLLTEYTHTRVVGGVVLGFRRPPVPEGVIRLACDATGGDRIREAVTDITPEGEVPVVHSIVQRTGVDITRSMRPAATHQLVGRFLAEHPEVERLGVIGYRPAVAELSHPLISRVGYFGRGDDRASNEWHKDCDALLIVGTPRVPTEAVRVEVVKAGGSGDGDGDFGPRSWEGLTADGSSVVVPTIGYRDPEWFAASKRLTRAGLSQAVGRARATLPSGIPVTVYGREAGLQSVIEDDPVIIWTDAEIELLRALGGEPKTVAELRAALGISDGALRERLAGPVAELGPDGRVRPTVLFVDVSPPAGTTPTATTQRTLIDFGRSDVADVLTGRLGEYFRRADAIGVLMERTSRRTAYRWLAAAIEAGDLQPAGGEMLTGSRDA